MINNHFPPDLVAPDVLVGEGEDGEDEGPDDHEDRLDEVCPDDGRQAAGHSEEAGDGLGNTEAMIGQFFPISFKG